MCECKGFTAYQWAKAAEAVRFIPVPSGRRKRSGLSRLKASFRKHSVSVDEVEQVFESRPHFRYITKGRRQKNENVYAAYGQTEEGRYLTVFFIYKPGHLALIISARDMDNKERKKYG